MLLTLISTPNIPQHEQCNDVVHGRGKRQLHEKRKLFNFYGIRCDYGDGEFPSRWPSEIDQDRERGYDFIGMTPKENYQDMLWQIAQYVPVVTGKWDPIHPTPSESTTDTRSSGSETTPTGTGEISAAVVTVLGNPVSGALFSESDFDEFGNSLWETFYDYSKEEYRQYHRLSKRVKSVQPSADSDSNGAVDADSTQYGEIEFWNPEHDIEQALSLGASNTASN